MTAKTRKGPAARELAKFEVDFAKSFGEGALITPAIKDYETVSTGSLTLDRALGVGGMVVGRMSEWWGPGSAGKTTCAMILAGEFQKAYPNRLIGWIDVEGSWDDPWAEQHGMDLLLVRKTFPTVAQDVADQAQKMMQSGLFSLIVLDSIGGMIGRRESEGTADEVQVAEVARVITRLVKQQASLLATHRSHLVLINQVRSRIGGYGGNTAGGGNAKDHATVHKLRFRQTGETPYIIKRGKGATAVEEEVGLEIAVHVERNKVAPPKRVATFNLFNQTTAKYGPIGIDRAGEAYVLGVRFGIIGNPSQGWYTLPDRESKVRGKDKVIAALRESSELVDLVRTKVLEAEMVDGDVEEDTDDSPLLDETDLVETPVLNDAEAFGS